MRPLVAMGICLLSVAGLVCHAKSSRSLGASAGTLAAPLLAKAPTGASLTNLQAPKPKRSAQGLPSNLQLDKAVLRGDAYELDLDGGRRVRLTLDPTLQRAAEKLLAQTRAPRAAVVVMAPDGRVLALAGRRTESPRGGKEGTVDPSLVTQVWAPAASIFKLVTAAALVRAGVTPSKKVCFHGGLRSVMASNLSDSPRDNRCEDLSYAVAHSQNAIIAKLTHQHLTADAISTAAADLGFVGEITAQGLAARAGALTLPVAGSTGEAAAEKQQLELAKMAAGFRGSELSVLGGGLLATTLANRGIEVQPTIISAIIDGDTTQVVTPSRGRRVLPAKVADAVAKMMIGTCSEGSAAKAFRSRDNSLPRDLKVAGKTGTLSRSEPFPMEYSWFVGFAPANDPQLAVSVVVGNTDDWWLKGHTVARELFETGLRTR